MIRPTKHLLLTPGPTPVPADVVLAMAQPIPHHRSPEFQAVFARVLTKLQRVYRTEQPVVLFSASGTGAFESAYVNLIEPGDKVLVVTAGNFGDRWVQMAEVFGADVEVLRYDWGQRPDPDEVAERVNGRDDLRAVVVVHSETSTGATADIQAIAERTRDRSALLLVDAISSLGAAPVETDAWGLDVVVTGSQKALMLPPGLAFVSLSERALARLEEVRTPRFYFDWRRALKAQAKNGSAFTPAVTLVLGLDVALDRILEAGIDALVERTRVMGAGVRAAAKALGLELFSPDDPDCSLVTAIRWPESVDGEAVRKAIRDRHGVWLVGGQGPLKGQIFRIGAFGAIEPLDLVAGIAALEQELSRAGYPVEAGAGVGALLGELKALEAVSA